jgi:GNAT superfamily N-acetyltransferase
MAAVLSIRRIGPGGDLGELHELRRTVLVEGEGLSEAAVAAELEDERGWHAVGCLGGRAVAALTLVETTGLDRLHARYGLSFAPGETVARYTRFVVLPHLRRQGIGEMLLAGALFALHMARKPRWSWLTLAPAHHGRTIPYGRLGFVAVEDGAPTADEHGECRVMTRDETAAAVHGINRRLLHVLNRALERREVRLELGDSPDAAGPPPLPPPDATAAAAGDEEVVEVVEIEIDVEGFDPVDVVADEGPADRGPAIASPPAGDVDSVPPVVTMPELGRPKPAPPPVPHPFFAAPEPPAPAPAPAPARAPAPTSTTTTSTTTSTHAPAALPISYAPAPPPPSPTETSPITWPRVPTGAYVAYVA